MTADLRKSVIRLLRATALLPPVPLGGRGWVGGGQLQGQRSSAAQGDLQTSLGKSKVITGG